MKNFVKVLDKEVHYFTHLQQRCIHIIAFELRRKFIIDQQIVT